MRKIFFLFFSCLLFADEPYELVDFGGSPSAIVGGCVNVITGDYVVNQDDLVVRGHEPIHIQRRYYMRKGEDYYGGWECGFNHLKAKLLYGLTLELPEKMGVKLNYTIDLKKAKERIEKKKRAYFKLKDPGGGITNAALGALSARNNPQNNVVYYKEGDPKEIIVKAPDGTKRFYRTFSSMSEVRKGLNEEINLRYYLRNELFPNGNAVVYTWEKPGKHRFLAKVRTKDAQGRVLSWVKFSYDPYDAMRIKWKHVETSDGRTLTYCFDSKVRHYNDKYSLLKEVRYSDQPNEKYDGYWMGDLKGAYLSWVRFPDGRFRNIHHYCLGKNEGTGVTIEKKDILTDQRYKRVKLLFEPVGTDQTSFRTYKFIYKPGKYKKKGGRTDVYDSYGNLTRYQYTKKYWLSAILHFIGSSQIFSKELFHWNAKGWLRSKVIADANGAPLSGIIYNYDDKGNVLQESFCGNLRGDERKALICDGMHFPQTHQADCYCVNRVYTSNHLVRIETFPNGMKVENSYLGQSELLSIRYIYDGNQIVRRHFYVYEGSILVKEIVDDGNTRTAANLQGATQRLIKVITPKRSQPFYGFPEVIEEQYFDLEKNCSVLLRKQVMTYNGRGLVTETRHYDAEGEYRYSLEYQYDERDRLVKQKDPLGRWRVIAYDANDNPIIDNDPNEGFHFCHEYDYSNRPIISTKIAESGVRKQVQNSYNFLHQKVSEVNEQGNRTQYEHDPLGHPTLITLPPIADEEGNLRSPQIRKTYNALGKVEQEINPEGNVTKYFYTSRGKPYRVIHPDGAEERYTYTLNGEEETHISPVGTRIDYQYDVHNRIVSKRICKEGTLLSEEKYRYSTFHLLEKTDADGVVTTYSYDGAGRKIREQTEDRVTLFGYDALGRLEKVIKCVDGQSKQVLIKEYDLLDRVIEEKELDGEGRLYGFTRYTYDDFSNKVALTKEVSCGEAVETYKYDPFRRLILKRDALGHETTLSYDDHYQNVYGQTVVQKTTTDPMGKKTIETFDTLGNLSHLEKQNSEGKTFLEERFFYDLNGKKVKQVSSLYDPDKTITKTWKYDTRGRLIKLTEADQKTTSYTYTLDGYLKTLTKPDGVVITYAYDGMGRQTSIQTSIQTSDNSCDYSFRYDPMGNIIESYDSINECKTTRLYNHFGDLLHETLANKHSLDSTYDSLGRKTSLQFSDGSSVRYTYDPYHLQTITRLDSSGYVLYEHTYTSYDRSHNLLQEKPLGKLDTIEYDVDLLSRRITTTSPYSTEHIPHFDPNGNVLETIRQTKEREEVSYFTYDDLDQIISESGLFDHDYSYDSHHNRLQKDECVYEVDVLHQLTATSIATYDHDSNGNRTALHAEDHEVIYTYDGLDRLTQIRCGNRAVRLSYDAWNRCLTRLNLELKNGEWIAHSPESYLYDDQNEIGIFPYHLRILGQGLGAEIGATIAIEHHQNLYVPMHDLFGNIIALLSPHGEVFESYRYTTFGEEEITTGGGCTTPYSFINPWRYQSKRKVTHLVYFGRRFYDPETGRWLSPDPKGFDEGPNLYHFLQNNPLIYFDFYGLSAESADRYSARQFVSDLKYVYYYTTRTTLEGFATANPKQMIGPLNAYTAIRNVMTGTRERPDIAHSKVFHLGDKHHSDVDFYYIPGMMTQANQANEGGESISKNLNNYEVKVMQNSSHGAFDILDFFLEKNGINTNICNLTRKQVQRTLNSGKKAVIFGYSEGNAIAKSAYMRFNPEEKRNIEVFGIGVADIHSGRHVGSTENYISGNDLIAFFGNPIKCISAAMTNASNVHFMSPASFNPFMEHSFYGINNQKALKDLCIDVSVKYGLSND